MLAGFHDQILTIGTDVVKTIETNPNYFKCHSTGFLLARYGKFEQFLHVGVDVAAFFLTV
jgi:hypothetical protein